MKDYCLSAVTLLVWLTIKSQQDRWSVQIALYSLITTFCLEHPRPCLRSKKPLSTRPLPTNARWVTYPSPSAIVQNISQSVTGRCCHTHPRPRASHSHGDHQTVASPLPSHLYSSFSANPCSSHWPDSGLSCFAHPPPKHHSVE